MKGSIPPHRFRPWVQGFFFVFFLFLFFRLSYPLTKNVLDNIFFTIDPLTTSILAITGTVAIGALLGSLALILASLVLGRVFCGYICPMGALFDFSARAFPAVKQRKPYGRSSYKNIKYYLLIFMVTGSIAGFTTLLLLDPLVFLYRLFAVTVYPWMTTLGNLGLNLARPLATKLGWFGLSMASFEQPVFAHGLLIFLMFLTVVGLIGIERRFWCRNLCPLGALLAVCSRFSLRKRTVAESCIGCGKCVQSCPVNAIDGDFRNSSSLECIQCERCADVCPVKAISFPVSSPVSGSEFSPSRRVMLITAGGGCIAGLAMVASVPTKLRAGNLLRPPGSLVEPDFLDACLRCGECMKACPTNGLQPAGLQSGIEGVFTPVLTPRIGGCEEMCNLCGQVCPTGAIRNLKLEEKQYAVIGNASVDRSRCIAWEQGKTCLVCDEACPFDAIEFRVVQDEAGAVKRPFVLEDKCVGCGQCEHACPVNGPSAIVVTPINEVRKNTGAYSTEEKRRLREVTDDFQDFSLEKKTFGSSPADSSVGINPEDDIPGGFTR